MANAGRKSRKGLSKKLPVQQFKLSLEEALRKRSAVNAALVNALVSASDESMDCCARVAAIEGYLADLSSWLLNDLTPKVNFLLSKFPVEGTVKDPRTFP